jgi:DNA polymerase (family 10)
MKLPLHTKLTNQELASLLSFISQVVGMNPKNHFRSRAYEVAGVIIGQLDYELSQRFSQTDPETFTKETEALPGIGESIAKKLVELFQTGTIAAFEKYTRDLPGGMYPLMQIHGIGAKKAFALSKQFELNDPETAVDELLTKAKHGLIRGLTGFGEKSELALITALEEKHQKGRIPRYEAEKIAQDISTALKRSGLIQKITTLGSLRRGAQTVGDIDLGVATKDTPQVTKLILDLPQVRRVLLAGENLVSIIVDNGWQADIKFAPESQWGSFIQHFTGSKDHNIKLREIALKKGLSLSEHGIKNKETGSTKTFANEEDFYTYLGFTLIPPNERVGGTEFEQYKIQ